MFGVVVVVVRTVPVQEEFWNRNLIGMKALLCMCGINSPARRYSARLSVSASAGEREEGEREGERGGRERERERRLENVAWNVGAGDLPRRPPDG